MLHYCHHHRAVVAVNGKDCANLLQGLITADVLNQPQGDVRYGALLTPQGRFLHDFLIFRQSDTLYLTPERARLDDLLLRLNRYKLRAEVTFTHNEQLFLISFSDAGRGVPDPRHPHLGYVALEPHLESNWTDYHERRRAAAVPDGSMDMIVGESLPLDYGLDTLGAVAWTKGCYVGQEVTARMHYKAQPKKKLVPITRLSGSFPDKGTELDTYGLMASHDGTHGLALLNIAHTAADTEVELKGGLRFVVCPQI